MRLPTMACPQCGSTGHAQPVIAPMRWRTIGSDFEVGCDRCGYAERFTRDEACDLVIAREIERRGEA